MSTLVREAYLPRSERETGDIVQALAGAGFFRLRGVLVGTVAYQCYSAVLGVRLSRTSMATGDADFAQFHSISTAVKDQMPSMLETLKAIDPTFREVPHPVDGRFATRFSSRSGYKVEFLTPNTGSHDYAGRPAPMPALGGASAEPLRFLDFLIYHPIRAVLLHGAGVLVNVAAPERYAIHKLIAASRRRMDNDGTAKSRKDLAQAVTMMHVMIEQRQSEDLVEGLIEACDRGPAWREAIRKSLSQILVIDRALKQYGCIIHCTMQDMEDNNPICFVPVENQIVSMHSTTNTVAFISWYQRKGFWAAYQSLTLTA